MNKNLCDLRETFKNSLNILNNRKASSVIGKKDKIRIMKNPKYHQARQHKDEDNLDRVINKAIEGH